MEAGKQHRKYKTFIECLAFLDSRPSNSLLTTGFSMLSPKMCLRR